MTFTQQLLERLIGTIGQENPMAPDTAASAAYEMAIDAGFSEDTAQRICDTTFELADALVVEAGKYL